MKRLYTTALAAALLSAVPAWADKPATTTAAAAGDTITLSGDGKAPRKCKILRTYKHPSGGTAIEVKDEASGEVMTVIENATEEQIKKTLKTEVTEVKPTPGTDPILEPKVYNSDPRVQKAIGAPVTPDPKPTMVTTPAPEKASAGPAVRPGTVSQSVVSTSKPVVKEAAPQPAPRRWFGWMRKETPAAKPVVVPSPEVRKKTTTPATTPAAPAPTPVIIEAAYHPDPVFRLIACLHDDLLPSMREVAAERLVREGQGRPEVVQALLRSAKTDPAPSVRACSIRGLGELRVATAECVQTLRDLGSDSDETVRQSAAAALSMLPSH